MLQLSTGGGSVADMTLLRSHLRNKNMLENGQAIMIFIPCYSCETG
jgi:hypothetical protein